MFNLFINGISLKSAINENVFPFNIPAIQNLRIRFRKPVTFLVGENGSGKSTLLEALAERCGFDLMGGHKQLKFIGGHGGYQKLNNLPTIFYTKLKYHQFQLQNCYF